MTAPARRARTNRVLLADRQAAADKLADTETRMTGVLDELELTACRRERVITVPVACPRPAAQLYPTCGRPRAPAK